MMRQSRDRPEPVWSGRWAARSYGRLQLQRGPEGEDWTVDFDELNEWLKKPSSYVQGTRMTFAGINNDKSRADVIAYLRSLSASPVRCPGHGAGGSGSGPAPAAK